jgi:hypothetical protein
MAQTNVQVFPGDVEIAGGATEPQNINFFRSVPDC